MRHAIRGFIMVIVLVTAATAGFARGAAEVDFLSAFEVSLGERGFSQEEAGAVAEAARALDWSDGRRADAELIAEAVARTQTAGDALDPLARAQVALALAKESVRLRTEGYAPNEVAEATLAAVSVLHDQISEWKDDGTGERLGEIVRNTVSDSTREAVRERTPDRTEAVRDAPATERVPEAGSRR